jgi:hypothetical protein
LKTPPPPGADSPGVRLPCPYLDGDVEWTDERARHIAERHPELLPAHRTRVEKTVTDPDEVRTDTDYPGTRLFIRWYGDLLDGKNVVVAVVSDEPPTVRHWIVTAFVARRPPRGDVEWKRR